MLACEDTLPCELPFRDGSWALRPVPFPFRFIFPGPGEWLPLAEPFEWLMVPGPPVLPAVPAGLPMAPGLVVFPPIVDVFGRVLFVGVCAVGVWLVGAPWLTGACCAGALACGGGAGFEGAGELLVLLCCAAAKIVPLTRTTKKAEL